MGILTVPCPKTGERVSTGVVIDPEAFALIDFQGHAFRCDACGEVHTWDKEDAICNPEDGP